MTDIPGIINERAREGALKIERDSRIAHAARILCREFICAVGHCRMCSPGSRAFEIAAKIVDSL